jgi:acyl transferase domain-containing protein/NADPH-dependent curcumin reductase CurA/acyl carrier protein/nucleoside-diphosphate-sugar epimerase
MSEPTQELSALKLALLAKQVREQSAHLLRADPIAIVGMACRLPGGADSPEAFWTLLAEGRDATTEVPAERWNADEVYSADTSLPGKASTRRGGFLKERIDQFDAAYFHILPREAASMDPQQRLLLEVAIEAFDDAGLPQERLRGSRTGVFIASYHNDYAQLQYNDPQAIDARTLTGTLHSVLANRLSYVLDLRGPSLSIDTACSSSLVATHLACQSLRHGESDIAIAGGVSLMLTPDLMVSLSKVGFMAPDGRCKTFDELADGFGRGEGCAVVVLKRLSDAVADGDRVLAVVRGSAVNQDGHSTLLAAPNGLAQQAMVREALANAQLAPQRIGYVEAHGTGTALGDPIEVEALAATVGRAFPGAGPCYLGAAKANIGHLEAGAGAAGLIKAVLSLRHQAIAPQPNFTRLSPHIRFEGTRLAVPTALTPWPRGAVPRCAAISSFGVGGTNAHVIVEEAPALPAEEAAAAEGAPQLLPLSARSPEALRALAARWVDFLAEAREPLSDVLFTAAERRTHHDVRLAVVGRSADELRARLNDFIHGQDSPAVATGQRSATALPRVGFVFSGQGPQWFAMGRELLADEPVFREMVEQCDALLRPLSGWSLLEQLGADEAASRLNDTEVAQPALFALQVALAALWKSWGVVPDAVVGHSVGEIAALHLAGALNLPDAIRVVWHRGRLMQQATGLGRMAAVGLSEEEAIELLRPLGDRLSLAALNGPRSVVLSGDEAALNQVLDALSARGVSHRLLPVQYAFHSAQMAPFQQRLDAELAGLRLAAPAVPVFSTVTGALLDGAPDTAYFGRNVRQGVRFAPAIVAMADEGVDTFIEIGPHPVLAASIAECLTDRETAPRVLASLRRGRPERETLLQAVAGVYAAGVTPAWDGLQPDAGQVVSLPAYPWQRKRHWIRARPAATAVVGTDSGHALLGRRLPLAGERVLVFEGDAAQAQAWLVDHRIQGRLLMPAAAEMDMLAAAARALFQVERVALESFTVLRPLLIAEGDEPATRWQVVATRGDEGDAELALHEALPDGGWRAVASALARTPDLNARAAAPRADALASIDTGTIYRRFAEAGAPFGPSFQVLREVRAGQAVAEAWLELPDGQSPQGHGLHPLLIDGALQLCSVAAGLGGEPAPRLFLPLGADRIVAAPSLARRVHARASVVSGPSSLSATVVLSLPDGTELLRLEGMRFAPADAGTTAPTEELLYHVHWQALPAAGAREPVAGRWLLLADRGGVGDALAAQLQQQGAHGTVLRAGDALDAVAQGPWRGVVHLWGLDTPSFADAATPDLTSDDWPALGSALALAQALVEQPAPLFLVSRGACVVVGDEDAGALQPRAAGLDGLVSVIEQEHPELRARAIDLDPTDSATQQADRLLAELLAGEGVPSRLALRGARRFAPQLRRPTADAARPGGPQGWAVAQAGTLDGLRLQPVTATPLGAGSVRLRVLAAGLNFRDVLLSLGMYQAEGVPLGAECAGVVIERGDGVTDLNVGDAVFGFAPGSLGDEVVVPAAFLARVPAGMDAATAAGLPVAYLTAMYGLQRLANLRAGQRVLIHAAAGGVGLAAVQLALRAGAEVFATAGSPDKRALLRGLGVQHVMDSRSLAFADEVRALTNGQGVHVVLNSLAGDFIPATLGVLGQGGVFLELGKRDIMSAASAAAARPDVKYHAYDLGTEALADHGLLRPFYDELLAALADGSLKPLPVREYPLRAAPEAMRFMAQAKHVGKLVLRVDAAPTVRADASYWITGGLGGLGLETARWLVAGGARHLVLSGRRAPDEHAQSVIAELRAQGATVRAVEADAADGARMQAVLDEITRDMPPLRGVVHAAGALDDAVLQRQTWPRAQAVLRGKAQGAWVLHHITRDRPLDFFVLYSAAGLWLGAAGQGLYPAANARLDALAQARRRAGLPALSVAWGAWGGVGMAARGAEQGHDAWGARGLRPITPATGFAALARAMRDDAAHALVLAIDWPRFLAQRPGAADSELFRAVAGGAGPTGTAASAPTPAAPGVRQRLQGLPSGQRRAALVAFLGERTLQVLGLDADTALDPRAALKDTGLDSLMAVELRNALAKAFAQPLPATLLFDYPTLDALAAHLLRVLGLEERAVAPAAPAAPAPAIDDMADLSDEEAEALLLRELDGGTPETS